MAECVLQRKDAFYVEFFELTGVTVDPPEREFLVQFLGVAVVDLDVDRGLEEERFFQTVKLFLNRLCGSLSLTEPVAHRCLPRLPDLQDRFLQ